jgi:hypothetical protein
VREKRLILSEAAQEGEPTQRVVNDSLLVYFRCSKTWYIGRKVIPVGSTLLTALFVIGLITFRLLWLGNHPVSLLLPRSWQRWLHGQPSSSPTPK